MAPARDGLGVMVIGAGAREHALATFIARSPHRPQVYCCPGNPGTARIATNVPIAPTQVDALLSFAEHKGIELAISGPEAPLAAGVADQFLHASIPFVGPTRLAAMLESSKSYAKVVMNRWGIPTADHRVFRDADLAAAWIKRAPYPVVIKADGLAAGKGVVVPASTQEALDAVDRFLTRQELGEAGSSILVEERLAGEEASYLVFCDGAAFRALAPARDYKRLLDGDQGPNTGGMGAYSPSGSIDREVARKIDQTIVRPLVDGMASVGIPYRGVLFVGLMLTREGPKVLEFNTRLGDPETQVILPRLHTDLLEVLLACADERLADVTPTWDARPAVGVVMASRGYPEAPQTGQRIEGLDQVDSEDVFVFHAGTAARAEGSSELVTSGGRVLTVVGLAPTLETARARAYEAVGKVHFEGMHVRKDIAAEAR